MRSRIALAGVMAVGAWASMLVAPGANAAARTAYLTDAGAGSFPPAIYRVNLQKQTKRLVASGGNIAQPAGIIDDGKRHVLVADADAGVGDHTGGVIRVNVRTGGQRLLSSNTTSLLAGGEADFQEPVGLARARNGTIFVTDESGSVIRVAPATGAEQLIASGPPLTMPIGILPASHGQLLVSDSQSRGVFRVVGGAPGQIRVGPPLVAPAGMTWLGNGKLALADQGAAGGNGAVFRIDPKTGATHAISRRGKFRSPFGVSRGPGRSLLVADTGALGAGDGRGALFRVNLASGAQHTILRGGFADLLGVVLAPH